jgi:hypothetical protein
VRNTCKNTHPKCRTTRKHTTHMPSKRTPRFKPEAHLKGAHMNGPGQKKPHLCCPQLQRAHAQVAPLQTGRAGKQLCERSLCSQGTRPHRGDALGARLSMWRSWFADASPPLVHGDCGHRDVCGRHHPLWPVQTHKSLVKYGRIQRFCV